MRGHNEGGIRQRPDGRWEASISLDWANGKRRRLYRYGKTRAEAAQKLRRAQHQVEAGPPLDDGRMTVDGLFRAWLGLQRNGEKSFNTIDNYEWAIRVHLVPNLGKARLTALWTEDVERVLQSMADSGLRRNTVVRVRNVMMSALKHAERRGLVARNVAAIAEMPRCSPATERRALSVEEGRALIEAARGDRLEALLTLGLMTALRPGELTGLRWDDVDLAAGRITVNGSMKRERGQLRLGDVKRSRAGMRTIDLARSARRALVEHRARQAAERLAAGAAWIDRGLVFSTALGAPIDPSNIRRTFARSAERAGIGPGCPYELRHTAASQLIDAGRSVEEVADLLGNDPRTLYRHYRHRTRGSGGASQPDAQSP